MIGQDYHVAWAQLLANSTYSEPLPRQARRVISNPGSHQVQGYLAVVLDAGVAEECLGVKGEQQEERGEGEEEG